VKKKKLKKKFMEFLFLEEKKEYGEEIPKDKKIKMI